MTRTAPNGVLLRAFLALSLVVFALAGDPAAAQTSRAPNAASTETPVGGAVPGDTLGTTSDSDYWRAVRHGLQGNVSIPDKKAGTLVQSEGEAWRSFRNGPLALYASWALLGTIVLLGLFYAIRGRIRIEHGKSDRTITRFKAVERFGHWMTAVSFVILGLTGLNVLYGRYVLKPILSDSIFGFISQMGKYLHNYLAFAFMAGLAMIFIMWVRHNLPDRTDIKWILQGGGIFSKKLHPPAKKFNAGQKVIFWLVIICGVSLSLSGWALLFPFTTHFFAGTFAKVNLIFGTDLPAALTALQEQQLNSLWHSIMAVFMICVILAHIYIGSIGMEGAFDAMGSGEVDLNWAKEHHSIWVEEHEADIHKTSGSGGAPQPAE
ncbi:formate dehydrogenase subunit gamma [Roseibium aggregatum]|uniref:Formate dehydrogenase subunit gamma n=1 Tax=Roseibium aggregatum TaxID=187304 RepID=A0A926P1B8_9HYPH|nr:formate dehydrogenase subunit gamma [Roseibium aggregatum]MBD1549434.1 formate dehydrogenase subunit gamma [Roseibium aggregatum]